MKYMLLFCREAGAPPWEELPEDVKAETGRQVDGWQRENASRIQSGHRLVHSSLATTVRRKGDRAIVTDGPFVEGNEVVGGYVIVDVPDLDEALRMAKTFPACPTVEIRPVAE